MVRISTLASGSEKDKIDVLSLTHSPFVCNCTAYVNNGGANRAGGRDTRAELGVEMSLFPLDTGVLYIN